MSKFTFFFFSAAHLLGRPKLLPGARVHKPVGQLRASGGAEQAERHGSQSAGIGDHREGRARREATRAHQGTAALARLHGGVLAQVQEDHRRQEEVMCADVEWSFTRFFILDFLCDACINCFLKGV